jgi:CheY-like chemotaxis protein
VFDWYEQVDAPKNRTISGTGLGLPITKRFADMMNGRIEVRSEYGKGSVFTVLLPLGKGDPEKIDQSVIPGNVIADGSIKALVVDDNTINLKVALAYLEGHNIRTDTAESGMEALEKIKQKQYDIVFMDHMMPEMDGLETTARIRAWEAEQRETPAVEPNDGMSFGSAETQKNPFARIPIIALSANAVSGARELFLSSGMNDYLYKPIEAGELNRLLGKWLPKDRITQKTLQDRETAPLRRTSAENTPAPGGNNSRPLIDRTVGIANAVNDESLYQSLLADFKASHGMDLEKATAAIQTEDYRTAHRLVHTLKSTANMIGAKTLGTAALAVEKALQENNSAPAQKMWEALEREFDAVMAELAQIVPEVPHRGPVPHGGAAADSTYGTGELLPGRELDTTRALAFIQKLDFLLKSGSSDSLRLRDDVREILGPLGEECGKLIALIDDLDFMEAAETLNQIREKIGAQFHR